MNYLWLCKLCVLVNRRPNRESGQPVFRSNKLWRWLKKHIFTKPRSEKHRHNFFLCVCQTVFNVQLRPLWEKVTLKSYSKILFPLSTVACSFLQTNCSCLFACRFRCSVSSCPGSSLNRENTENKKHRLCRRDSLRLERRVELRPANKERNL